MLYIYIKKPEIWRSVTYPNVKPDTYLISNHGQVYSKLSKKILKPGFKTTVRDNGEKRTYKQVVLVSSDTIMKQRKYLDINIHRLVAWEFIPNPNPDIFDFVHHRNNDSLENYYENLEWVDNRINQLEAKFIKSSYSLEFIHELCKLIYIEKYNNSNIYSYILNKYGDKFTTKKLSSLISHLRIGDRHIEIINKYK